MDVLFSRDHAVLFHEHQRHFLELGIDALAVFEFDRVAMHDVAIAADDFDKLAGFGLGFTHTRFSNRDVSPTPRF
jgi:hypothetical protein